MEFRSPRHRGAAFLLRNKMIAMRGLEMHAECRLLQVKFLSSLDQSDGRREVS